MSSRPTLDPAGALAAFGRAAYSDLTSVVALSLLFSVAAIPVVTLGPAIIAIVAATHEGVTERTAGGRTTERERIGVFVRTFRSAFRRGALLTALPVAVAAVTVWYAGTAIASRSGPLLIGSLLGVYAFVATFAVAFRAATLLTREGAPSTRHALWDAARHLLAAPAFSALHVLFVGLVILICVGLGVAVPLLLPGLLAVLEVVAYEETAGGGAIRVVKAYQGELLVEGDP
ncbi:hypothetical protein [Halobaculum roseum]|uniref:DUF624 domain-containing protein n=1 Tax=Halobaculum roseum TaxID=2175149 RepID=A0ABD5MQY3_9EURY|nr:hypothetical protein [Halobaculum roseum]QZY03132.1 hypothetical protein K6T36_02780 [Halobaculum roseum]